MKRMVRAPLLLAPLALVSISTTLVTSFSRAAQDDARKSTFITFDVPSAVTGPGLGTLAFGINASGAILGNYADASIVLHGFLRAPDGAITTIDAPGAATGYGQGTHAGGLNNAGEITGSYVDVNNANHGYLRTRSGAITTFDAPGAGTDSGQGTVPGNINSAGEIGGYYVDAR